MSLRLKLTLFLILGFRLFSEVKAQSGNVIWAKSSNGYLNEIANAITIDSLGNSYITGSFEQTADFDPGPGIVNLTSVGFDDIFILKLNSAGSFVWVKQIGGQHSDQGYSICLDGAGNIYTTGFFMDTVDFDPGAGVFELRTTGDFNSQLFVLKLDSAGNFVWAKSTSGIGNGNAVANCIKIDHEENVIATGNFSQTVDFDSDSSNSYFLTAVGFRDIFILKLDSIGNFLWVKAVGGIEDDFGYSIAIENDNDICVTGVNSEDAYFDPDSLGIFILGLDGAFILKLDKNGQFKWVKSLVDQTFGFTFGWGTQQMPISVDNSGNIISAGLFTYTADFDPGPATFLINCSADYPDIYILKLDSNGNFIWAKSIPGGWAEWDYLGSLVLDQFNNISIVGGFGDTCDFDPGVGEYNLTSQGNVDIFFLKLDSYGNFVSAKSFGGTSFEAGSSIAMDDFGNSFISGSYSSVTLIIDTVILTSAQGFNNVYVVKLACPSESVINATACGSYISPSGNFFYNSGIFYDTIFYGGGCISTFIINLAITNMDSSSITQSGSTLISNSINCTYQWLNCDNGFQSILWATNQSYTPTSSGNYAVEIKQNGCKDTSVCHYVLVCPSESVINVNACESYISPSGNFFYNSGIYYDTIYSGGCLSTFIINLTVNTIDTAITQSGSTLISNSINCTYRWLNCDNGLHSIFGATNQTYTPTSSGNYAVEINLNGCKDTSACHYVLVNGLSDFNHINFVKLFPDPVQDELTIETLNGVPNEIEIANSFGVIVMKFYQTKPFQSINIHSLPAGIYFVKMKMNDGSLLVGKFVKE